VTLNIVMGITSADHNTEGLPEGWVLTTLQDACEINPPKASKDSLPADAPVTFVPMPAVDAEEGAITKPQTKRFSEVRKGFTSFRENDVIMAKITPCMENGKGCHHEEPDKRSGIRVN
jgi:type I restriction enzyme S subunit